MAATVAMAFAGYASLFVAAPAWAIAVALAAFGLINRDGLLVVLGCLLGFVWVSALLVLGPTALLAAVHLGKDWLTGLIS